MTTELKVGAWVHLLPGYDYRTGEPVAQITKIGRKYIHVKTPRGIEFPMNPEKLGALVPQREDFDTLRRAAKAQHRVEAPRVGAHPRTAKTPEAVAALDTSSVVLRYRQLCAQVDRAAGLHNAVSKFSSPEADATLKSLNDLTALRDMFRAEAKSRNAI